ncbi:hypothetical protein ACK8GE_07065 [Micromonosporaceae bacterium DT194]|uniref:hypothetical protein n=1 Tax=Melissospora conviva TaxID=3388432 RepID=UPI003C1EC25B
MPSNEPLTIRQLATRFTQVNGAPAPKLAVLPHPLMRAAGLLSPMVRELETTRYQFTAPFVMDSTAATETFGLTPEPFDDALREAAQLLRAG